MTRHENNDRRPLKWCQPSLIHPWCPREGHDAPSTSVLPMQLAFHLAPGHRHPWSAENDWKISSSWGEECIRVCPGHFSPKLPHERTLDWASKSVLHIPSIVQWNSAHNEILAETSLWTLGICKQFRGRIQCLWNQVCCRASGSSNKEVFTVLHWFLLESGGDQFWPRDTPK